MSEPTVVAIPIHELKDWLDRIAAGHTPSVEFRLHGQGVMLEDAYKVRGDILYYINHRIRAFVGTEIP